MPNSVLKCAICGYESDDPGLIKKCEDGVVRCLSCRCEAMTGKPGEYEDPEYTPPWELHLADTLLPPLIWIDPDWRDL